LTVISVLWNLRMRSKCFQKQEKKKNQKSRDEVGKSQSVIWNVYVEA
jgi:hypothetical protein